MIRRTILVVMLLVAVLASGCTGSEESDGPGPTDSPTSATSAGPDAEVPQAEALVKIEVAGPPDSPISWRLPAGATRGSPVGVTQRFLALYGQGGTPGTDPDVTVVSTITDDSEVAGGATGAMIRSRIRDGYVKGETRSGPLWVWLDSAASPAATARSSEGVPTSVTSSPRARRPLRSLVPRRGAPSSGRSRTSMAEKCGRCTARHRSDPRLKRVRGQAPRLGQAQTLIVCGGIGQGRMM